jgi:hypothetical protein
MATKCPGGVDTNVQFNDGPAGGDAVHLGQVLGSWASLALAAGKQRHGRLTEPWRITGHRPARGPAAGRGVRQETVGEDRGRSNQFVGAQLAERAAGGTPANWAYRNAAMMATVIVPATHTASGGNFYRGRSGVVNYHGAGPENLYGADFFVANNADNDNMRSWDQTTHG